MSTNYLIQDVPMEIILHIGKLVQSSSIPLVTQNIIKGMASIAAQAYTTRGITMAKQMNLIQLTDDKTFKGTMEYKTDFENY